MPKISMGSFLLECLYTSVKARYQIYISRYLLGEIFSLHNTKRLDAQRLLYYPMLTFLLCIVHLSWSPYLAQGHVLDLVTSVEWWWQSKATGSSRNAIHNVGHCS